MQAWWMTNVVPLSGAGPALPPPPPHDTAASNKDVNSKCLVFNILLFLLWENLPEVVSYKVKNQYVSVSRSFAL